MNAVLIICSIASAHALFWACVLFNLNKRLSNRLLALLLIMVALRVGKSVTGIVLPGHLYFFSTVGVISMAAIGPLLFLFTKSFFERSFQLRPKDYIHYIPAAALLPVLVLSRWSLLSFSYYLFTTHVFVYLILAAFYLITNREVFKTDDLKWRWMTYIIIAMTFISVTFVLQLIFYHPAVYKLIVITAAIVFYVLTWWAIPRSRIFIAESKKKNEEVHTYEEIGKNIQQLLENDELFTDPSLTVSKMAALLRVPAYLVSKAINHYFDKSFSELLTSYRIKKSEKLLLNDASKTLTIEAIAYESGFNTLSSYYTAFKKINNITPAQFRDSGNQSKMKIA